MKIALAASDVVVQVLADDESIIMSYSVSKYALSLDINKLISEAGGIAGLMQGIERKFVEAARAEHKPEPRMSREEAIDKLMAMTFGARTGRSS